MNLVADLHIHSHYSRATSKDLTFEHLSKWAQIKGVHVVASGDVTHPGWLQEMRLKLEPAEAGLFRLKPEYAAGVQVPPACQGELRFILGGEISSIYKKDGATRKVHNVVFAPSLEAVERLQTRLEKIGNIRADGRPILGLDSRDLLAILLEIDPECYLIPAHIWTPWFSLLGSKSGFDSVEACFGDLTEHIFALETGLSSDPPMNWRVSALDRYTLVSNSDAHSPQKLAREATLFNTELAYPALFAALRSGDPAEFGGTVEFFPEEGKYHRDGHRACGIAWDPPTTLEHNGICPVCGKPVTVGVLHRVEVLADRLPGAQAPRKHPFYSLIPLPEILSEVHGSGPASQKVSGEYEKLLARLGPELAILRDLPLEEIAKAGGERLAEGIGRMRRGEVTAQAGYDGEYGVIKLFAGEAVGASSRQMGLFGLGDDRGALTPDPSPTLWERGEETRIARTGGREEGEAGEEVREGVAGEEDREGVAGEDEGGTPGTGTGEAGTGEEGNGDLLAGLNPEQRAAALATDRAVVIVAGPGTGKTRTLTVRIAHLVRERGVAPESILAITFTNKAAGEMGGRLQALLGAEATARLTLGTFHAFGAGLLRSHAGRLGLPADFAILSEEERQALLRDARPDLSAAEVAAALEFISAAKNRLLPPEAPELLESWALGKGEALGTDGAPGDGGPPPEGAPLVGRLAQAYADYEAVLRLSHALDFDDLLLLPVRLLESSPELLAVLHARYHWISVDEYQDVNLAQYRLLRLLAGGGANLCVIGDPDQAIYGFRGADRRYFLTFREDYPEARVLALSQNYRSTQNILAAATQVIAHGREAGAGGDLSAALQVWSEFSDQVRLDIHRAPTGRAEAEYVVHTIEQMVGGTSYFSLDSGRVSGADPAAARSFGDFAVLYRLGAQSHLLLEAFERSGIPFQTSSTALFYTQPAVREVLAHLWLLHTPASRLHLEAVLAAGKPAFSSEAARRLAERTATAARPGDLAETLAEAAGDSAFTAAQRRRLSGLAELFDGLAAALNGGTPLSGPYPALIAQVNAYLGSRPGADLGEAAQERRRQLELRAAPYGSRLGDFLEAAALHTETDAYDSRADRVSLMTLHAAKGLEFPVVFIVGCEEGLLPYTREGEPPDVAEERRLFYVGLTRARSKLILTHAGSRQLFGRRVENPPSRFLDDIESALKELRENVYHRPEKPKPDGVQLSLF